MRLSLGQLTASEARLPQKCQQHALQARKRSRRIRIHIAVLLALYTGWTGFQIAGSVYNARRGSSNAFAREYGGAAEVVCDGLLSAASAARRPLQNYSFS